MHDPESMKGESPNTTYLKMKQHIAELEAENYRLKRQCELYALDPDDRVERIMELEIVKNAISDGLQKEIAEIAKQRDRLKEALQGIVICSFHSRMPEIAMEALASLDQNPADKE